MSVIIVSLSDDVRELRQLVQSFDDEIVGEFIQHKKPEPKYYIGRGKVDEIKEFVKVNNIDRVIMNCELKGPQHYHLEQAFQCSVWDRTRLILEIFARRARSPEARLQVEYARLEYEIPLMREWVHRARHGERPGFLAGGGYELDQYLETIQRRKRVIQKKLGKISEEREIRRKHRRRRGFFLVSICGYTNAGKSTLLNYLTDEKVIVEDRLFSTLSTTTRKGTNRGIPILFTDTVGFIENVPYWLIDAFHSTLEEIFVSDIVLLLVDSEDTVDEIMRKLDTSSGVLFPDTPKNKIILVLSKIDCITDEDLNNKITKIQASELWDDVKVVPLSCITEEGIENLVSEIQDKLAFPYRIEITLPYSIEQSNLINKIYRKTMVLNASYGNDCITLQILSSEKDRKWIEDATRNAGGILTYYDNTNNTPPLPIKTDDKSQKHYNPPKPN